MVGSKVPGPETTLSEAALHKSQTLNQKYHVTERSNTYYEKAVTSSVGQKVRRIPGYPATPSDWLAGQGLCILDNDHQTSHRHP